MLFPVESLAEKDRKHSLNVQGYGYAGTTALGFGHQWRPSWAYFLLVGASDLDKAPVYQFTGKLQFQNWKLSLSPAWLWQPLYGGLILTYTWDKDYFITNPHQYPYSTYYNESAVRAGFYLGTEFEWSWGPSRYGLYYEVIILDAQLLAYMNNLEKMSLTDVLGAGIGWRMYF